MSKYPINIVWSDEDGEYMATCTSFAGLSAFGETEEEALREAKIALELFIESYKERGLALPKPPRNQTFSGQLRLRLSRSLHERAARLASKDGVSLNQYINNALNREVATEEASSSR